MGSGSARRLGLTWVKPQDSHLLKGEGGRDLSPRHRWIQKRTPVLSPPNLDRKVISQSLDATLCRVRCHQKESTALGEQARQSESSNLLLNPLQLKMCHISLRSVLYLITLPLPFGLPRVQGVSWPMPTWKSNKASNLFVAVFNLMHQLVCSRPAARGLWITGGTLVTALRKTVLE